ncbi:MAG: hypothetical protein KGJ41_08050 [Rhodospirillales bacterium]|nr:hypothetical protein [Rhodospirillales bacterium]MDE2574879.1 hypothetical protein [Rhodospirillales bacterium]
MRGLGIDGGGSATRWAICDAAGGLVARGELPAVVGHLTDAAGLARLAAICAGLPRQMAVGRIVAGITGLSAGTAEAAGARDVISAAVHLAPAAVEVRDDMWIAYHAAFAPGAGHLVYAGSGSIGVHLRADGALVRVGGRGFLIDDGGSAFWIGRTALDLVWRRLDREPGWCSPLSEALHAAAGGASWDAVRRHVYGGGRNAVAQLARAVAAADDDDARAILHAAGSELARLALALCHREGNLPVVLTGRAAGLHAAILAGFRAAAPLLGVRHVETDAALAAARLAVGARPEQGRASGEK